MCPNSWCDEPIDRKTFKALGECLKCDHVRGQVEGDIRWEMEEERRTQEAEMSREDLEHI